MDTWKRAGFHWLSHFRRTTAMVIRDQVEVAVGDILVLPVDETTALLCVFGDVAISLLLL